MLEDELRTAAAVGVLDDVLTLLHRGADFAPDTSGRTPLHLAAAAGSADIVAKLATTSNVNQKDAVGRTALQIAATGGHVEVVNVLLKCGANPNIRDNLHGNAPLHEASWHGFSHTVRALCSDGNSAAGKEVLAVNKESRTKADPDVRNSAGFFPLHLACQAGHNQSCRELLLAGADPDVQNNYGDTALHTSARYGHAGVARILISASCRVSDQNKNGDTALHIAAAMGRRKLTTILLEAGCDKTIRNKQYETACDIATRKDLNEIIIILQNVKPSKSSKKKTKKTSETSDSDKKSKESRELICVPHAHDPQACSSSVRWSPYGCHYYPDPSSFPQPKLDSLPGEPLSKGEQYYLDLAGNIRKGPVGVGLTCYCANFLRDMETRLEKNNLELKHRIKLTRQQLEDRVVRTEGLLSEMLLTRGRSEKKEKRRGRDKEPREAKPKRSHSVDLLQNTPTVDKGTTSNSSRKSTPILPPPPDAAEMAEVEARLKELSVRAEAIEKTEWLLAATAAAASSVASPSSVSQTSSPVVYAPPRSRLALYDPHLPSFECLSDPDEIKSCPLHVPETKNDHGHNLSNIV